MVTDSVQMSHNSHTDTTHEFLNQTAWTLGVDVEDANQKYNESKSNRFQEPVNEFIDGDFGMIAAFFLLEVKKEKNITVMI